MGAHDDWFRAFDFRVWSRWSVHCRALPWAIVLGNILYPGPRRDADCLALCVRGYLVCAN